jgi:hypothetical protein
MDLARHNMLYKSHSWYCAANSQRRQPDCFGILAGVAWIVIDLEQEAHFCKQLHHGLAIEVAIPASALGCFDHY